MLRLRMTTAGRAGTVPLHETPKTMVRSENEVRTLLRRAGLSSRDPARGAPGNLDRGEIRESSRGGSNRARRLMFHFLDGFTGFIDLLTFQTPRPSEYPVISASEAAARVYRRLGWDAMARAVDDAAHDRH